MDRQASLSVTDSYWHKVIGNMINTLDKPNFWNVLIRYISDWIEFDSWVILRFSKRGKPVVLAENNTEDGSVDQLFVDYINGFYLLDPFFISCIDDPRAGLFRLNDVAPDNFEFEDYYQRYFKLNIVADEVQFNMPVNGGDVVILSLGSKRRYSPSDMSLMFAIEPWILALIRQRCTFDELAEYRIATKPDVTEIQPSTESQTSRSTGDTSLTSRELEIMQLLLSGFSSKGIAQKLHISPETVKAHRRHIYIKLGVKSHPELFTIYLKRSLDPQP